MSTNDEKKTDKARVVINTLLALLAISFVAIVVIESYNIALLMRQ